MLELEWGDEAQEAVAAISKATGGYGLRLPRAGCVGAAQRSAGFFGKAYTGLMSRGFLPGGLYACETVPVRKGVPARTAGRPL